MKKTVCDLCKHDVVDRDSSGDIRYVDFTKIATGNESGREKGDVIPVHPALEICVLCSEKAYKAVMGADYGKG